MKINYIAMVDDVVEPSYAYKGDAGMDLTAITREKSGNWFFPLYTYRTGIALELPKTHFVMLVPRSSLSKKLMWMANHIGIVDSNYRGELLFKFRSILGIKPYKIGERIGQMILRPKSFIELNKVDDINTTERNGKGFGSSGN